MKKKALWLLCVVCVFSALFMYFALIGYKFSGILLLLLGGFFAFLALTLDVKARDVSVFRTAIIIVVALGIFLTACLTAAVLINSRGDEDAPADYLIVLGAGLDGEIPSLTLAERLERARIYLESNPHTIAIVSGGMGSGETVTEAFAMRRYLISHGISENRIICEDKATSTLENLMYSRDIINNKSASVAVISSEYHIMRARMLAKRTGLSPVMISAKTTYPVLKLNYAVREAFAVASLYIFK